MSKRSTTRVRGQTAIVRPRSVPRKPPPDSEPPSDSSGVPRTSKGEASRTAIVNAASELFANRGFGDISISDIAERASVNRAMIAYYFKSKAGLYDAILEDAIREITHELGELSAPCSEPQSVRTLVESFGRVYARRPHLPAMIARQMIDPGHILTSKATEVLGKFSSVTKHVLASVRLRAKGYDSQAVHLIIVGAIIYFLLSRPYREKVWNQPAWILSRQRANDRKASRRRLRRGR